MKKRAKDIDAPSRRAKESVICYILVGVVAFTCVLPLWIALVASLSDETEIVEKGFSLMPRKFTLETYKFIIKNKGAMEVFCNALKNNDSKIPIKTEAPRITEQVSSIESVVIPMHREYKEPFEVSSHIRNLHEGWKASPEKLERAAAYGIDLLPGQTLVESYTKGEVA